MLTDFSIPFVVDTNLVRGLDYYDHLVFEFMSSSAGTLIVRESSTVPPLGYFIY